MNSGKSPNFTRSQARVATADGFVKAKKIVEVMNSGLEVM